MVFSTRGVVFYTMSSIDVTEVKEEFQDNGWDITDFVQVEDQSSITARTSDGIRVVVDEYSESDEMNNFFVKSPRCPIEKVRDFQRASEIADDPILIRVTGPEFSRLWNSTNFDGSEEELVSNLVDKGSSNLSLQFARLASTESVDIAEAPKIVSNIRSMMDAYE